MIDPIDISVVMPVFNAEETLDEAIQSICNQSCDNFEFIIVDDGSNDSSRQILKRWAQKDTRITPIYDNHHGIVSALNTGIEQANGTYLARMDADDISLPTRLEKQANYLNDHPDIGLVSCLVKHLGNQKKQEGYARYVDWINGVTSIKDIRRNRFIESPIAHPSVCFRRSLIKKYGGYRDGIFPEDYELWLRWLDQGMQMFKLPEVLLEWRDQDDRLSRNHSRYSPTAFYKIKAKYLARWLQQENPYHPYIVIWGAGRTSRKRAELLTQYGIHITNYIDVDPKKIGQNIHGRPVWGPNDIPEDGARFIVSYVGNRGVNQKIFAYLNKQGYDFGRHFIFAA